MPYLLHVCNNISDEEDEDWGLQIPMENKMQIIH